MTELENSTAKSRKIKMLLHDDVAYQILLWLPVISLLRFKLVCRTWRAFIESNDFIKQHLHHHHHYDPSLKDKNHNLIHIVQGRDSPFTFPLISVDSFEGSNACVQLDCSDLREYYPLTIYDIVSYNGIVCLNLFNCKGKHNICLWNPASKQSRILPQSPALRLETKHNALFTVVGVGFDVENNDYKVVNICRKMRCNEDRVEVYSLNTDSWRSVTTVFPLRIWLRNPKIPFNNGTCFFWHIFDNFGSEMIHCFDFSSEKFHFISFPNASNHVNNHHVMVVSDKIACVSRTNDHQTEIWVLNGYGSVNQSWVKLYTIDSVSEIKRGMSVVWLSMGGNYILFRAMSHFGRSDVVTKMVCGYNVVTKEIKNLSTVEIGKEAYYKDWRFSGLRVHHSDRIRMGVSLVEYKESLLSVGKGNSFV